MDSGASVAHCASDRIKTDKNGLVQTQIITLQEVFLVPQLCEENNCFCVWICAFSLLVFFMACGFFKTLFVKAFSKFSDWG